jgi:putative hydrolase of the HAD superfamily
MPRFVFDLDDTLYLERDYVRSAFDAVAAYVQDHFGGESVAQALHAAWAGGAKDPIGTLWSEKALPLLSRDDALAVMRAHSPAISLRPDAAELLAALRCSGAGYAIVTDGRSVTQRAKLIALGCDDARYISISEEIGLAKTDPARFLDVSSRLGDGRWVYVGDNPAKDFYAPKLLGWKTVMIDNSGLGIHSQDLGDDERYHPDAVVASFAQIAEACS